MNERQFVGLQYLKAGTALLRRIRRAHATAGLLEAADLQWWWRSPRSTDELGQLFWIDSMGRPEAAVIATDWGDGIGLDPIVMPDADPDWRAHVIRRGLAYAGESGFVTVDVAVDQADGVMRDTLSGHGFAVKEGARLTVVNAWLSAAARPQIGRLHGNYRLLSRLDTIDRPHHMSARSGPGVEARLRQASLYRPDLDLLVVDDRDEVAAYALFWFDPETATGLIEPMRTESPHQRRGLARYLLTAGVERLAEAGARSIKVCFRPHDPAASALYLGAGFEPKASQTAVYSGRSARQT